MPLPPQRHNPSPTNADQTVTKVDTRLTKLTTVNPTPLPNPSKTRQNRTRTHHPDNPIVNPSGASRTTLNKSEHRRRPPAASHPHLTSPWKRLLQNSGSGACTREPTS